MQGGRRLYQIMVTDLISNCETSEQASLVTSQMKMEHPNIEHTTIVVRPRSKSLKPSITELDN